jgi:hypothetical protein
VSPEEQKRAYLNQIIGRNIEDVQAVFDDDPSKILVSVQLEEDQIEHLGSGLRKRNRRLIPLTVLARFIHQLNFPGATKPKK